MHPPCALNLIPYTMELVRNYKVSFSIKLAASAASSGTKH